MINRESDDITSVLVNKTTYVKPGRITLSVACSINYATRCFHTGTVAHNYRLQIGRSTFVIRQRQTRYTILQGFVRMTLRYKTHSLILLKEWLTTQKTITYIK